MRSNEKTPVKNAFSAFQDTMFFKEFKKWHEDLDIVQEVFINEEETTNQLISVYETIKTKSALNEDQLEFLESIITQSASYKVICLMKQFGPSRNERSDFLECRGTIRNELEHYNYEHFEDFSCETDESEIREDPFDEYFVQKTILKSSNDEFEVVSEKNSVENEPHPKIVQSKKNKTQKRVKKVKLVKKAPKPDLYHGASTQLRSLSYKEEITNDRDKIKIFKRYSKNLIDILEIIERNYFSHSRSGFTLHKEHEGYNNYPENIEYKLTTQKGSLKENIGKFNIGMINSPESREKVEKEAFNHYLRHKNDLLKERESKASIENKREEQGGKRRFLIAQRVLLNGFFKGENIHGGKPTKINDIDKAVLKQIKRTTGYGKDSDLLDYVLNRRTHLQGLRAQSINLKSDLNKKERFFEERFDKIKKSKIIRTNINNLSNRGMLLIFIFGLIGVILSTITISQFTVYNPAVWGITFVPISIACLYFIISKEKRRRRKVIRETLKRKRKIYYDKIKLYFLTILVIILSISCFVSFYYFYYLELSITCGFLIPVCISILLPRSWIKTDQKIKRIERRTRLPLESDKDQDLQVKNNSYKKYFKFYAVNTPAEAAMKIKAVMICAILLVFPFFIGCFPITNSPLDSPAVTFALVPQEYRRAGIDFNFDDLEFLDKPEDLNDITFNSLLVMKLKVSAGLGESLSIVSQLVPTNDNELLVDPNLKRQVYHFSSIPYTNIFNQEVLVELDLDNVIKRVIPGNYELQIYALQNKFLAIGKTSQLAKFNVTIEKDKLYFTPHPELDPLTASHRGSIYSVKNDDILGWDHLFESKMTDSMGRPVSGMVSLYMTKREGNRPVFKKLLDYNTKEDGIISYRTITRNHFKEYQQGKIEYNGEKSDFYRSATHVEDMDESKNKFLHTSYAELDGIHRSTNGTDLEFFNKNEFQTTDMLKYHHEFAVGELAWTESPNFNYYSGPPSVVNRTITTSGSVNVTSPQVGYIGTIADTAMIEYRYAITKISGGTIDVDTKLQVIRDGDLIYEEFDIQNSSFNGNDLRTVYVPITSNFTEGGQIFQFRLCAAFSDVDVGDEYLLKIDWFDLEVHYPPTYYRGFDFNNGFNDFASPTMGSVEPIFWNTVNPISVGREILTYDDYSGLVNNNDFSNDFRQDNSWWRFSGLFSETNGIPVFNQDDGVNLPPTWRDQMAMFDLQSFKNPINVSDAFASLIKDEFTSFGDDDYSLEQIRQRYIVPRVVSSEKQIVIVFAGRYATDGQWKLYLTHAARPDGEFSEPIRVYETSDDDLYQLAPSIAITEADLHIVWQERNWKSHSEGESEWGVKYARMSLDDFTLEDLRNVTSIDQSNINATAFVSPDIALTPTGNAYAENGSLIGEDLIVHVSYENCSWIDSTPGSRDNDDNRDVSA